MTDRTPLLWVEELTVDYAAGGQEVRAVDQLSFSLESGRRLGIVGESGSGKSTVALALLGLLPPNARVKGSARFEGVELIGMPRHKLRQLWGASIAVVFQDAKAALDPVRTIGSQITEAIMAHGRPRKGGARERAEELLRDVDIPQPGIRLGQYPHELSGGMRQRAMLAIALAAHPKLLIADEPTSALDVTTQAEVIALLDRLCQEHAMSVILITHDLGVVARFADSVLVMYAGAPMEAGSARDLFKSAEHPYTRALISSVPRLDEERVERLRFIPGTLPRPTETMAGCRFEPRCPVGYGRATCVEERPAFVPRTSANLVACHFPGVKADEAGHGGPTPDEGEGEGSAREGGRRGLAPLLRVHEVSTAFPVRRGGGSQKRLLHALTNVSLTVGCGEAVGIVGESGSGKTTLARVIVGLERYQSGQLLVLAANGDRGSAEWEPGAVQMIFQDPSDSLDPTMSIQQVVAEPMMVTRRGAVEKVGPAVQRLLGDVGLGPQLMTRKPWQLSGGQQQRVAIARALATNPVLLVCDEPVSSLDVSARGQILNLLKDLRERQTLSILQISHDLSVVRHTCDRVAVMYAGRLVELAETGDLFRRPQHPYTETLIEAVPIPDPDAARTWEKSVNRGDPPDLTMPIEGCPFRSRCPRAGDICATAMPALLEHEPEHWAACHFPQH